MAVPLSPEMLEALQAQGDEILARLHNEQPSRLALTAIELRALRAVLHTDTWEAWTRAAAIDRDHQDTADAIARCGGTVIVPAT